MTNQQSKYFIHYPFLFIIWLFAINIVSNSLALSNNQFVGLEQRIEQISDELTVPAMAIAVFDKKKILFKKLKGTTANDNKILIADNTVFQIASLSKSFIGGLLAVMHDQGVFSWHDIINKKVRNFSLKNQYYTDILSFHHLAAMQTGLPEYALSKDLINFNYRNDIIKAFSQVESIQPGHKFSYQYAIFSVIEEFIRNQSGLEWNRYLQRKILDPLKLINTGININQLSNLNIAKAYDKNNKIIEWEDFKVKSAAGMYSSLNDLISWTQFHLQEGIYNNRQIISKAQINALSMGYTPLEIEQLYFVEQENIKDIMYGYFWKSYYYLNNQQKLKVIEHTGRGSGVSCLISFIPSKEIGIVILTNKSTTAPEQIREELLKLITQ